MISLPKSYKLHCLREFSLERETFTEMIGKTLKLELRTTLMSVVCWIDCWLWAFVTLTFIREEYDWVIHSGNSSGETFSSYLYLNFSLQLEGDHETPELIWIKSLNNFVRDFYSWQKRVNLHNLIFWTANTADIFEYFYKNL